MFDEQTNLISEPQGIDPAHDEQRNQQALAGRLSDQIADLQRRFDSLSAEARARGLPPPQMPALPQNLNNLSAQDLANVQTQVNNADQQLNGEEGKEIQQESGEMLASLGTASLAFHGIPHALSHELHGSLAKAGVHPHAHHVDHAQLFTPTIDPNLRGAPAIGQVRDNSVTLPAR